MKARLSAVLLLLVSLPAAAQLRGGIESVPTLTPGLGGGFTPIIGGSGGTIVSPSFGSAPTLKGSFDPASFAPSIQPMPSPLVPSAIVGPSAVPTAFAPAALTATVPAASKNADRYVSDGLRRRVVHSLKDLRLLEGVEGEAPIDPAGGELFDGGRRQKPLVDGDHAAKPIGAYGVSTVRVHSAEEAAQYIPATTNTQNFVKELRTNWSRIGWLDLRLYRDNSGNFFRAVDMTGRPELVDQMPELQPHEKALVRKIQLYTDDLQIVLREEGKTPDLIVAGVVTEMKSLHNDGIVSVQLEHADAQLKAHSARHGLGKGAVAIDILDGNRSWDDIGQSIKDYVGSHDVGFDRVEIYHRGERRIFMDEKTHKAEKASNARFLVPNALFEAPEPDPDVILREVTEPAKRLREAGVKATVTVYGSARIIPPDRARAELAALIKKWGAKPKQEEARKLLYSAKQAVEVSKYYEIARRFGEIVAENGGGEVAVVTGGGPGIMEAANRGAFEAGGPSVGYNIILEKEQGLNKYATKGLAFEFQHFATRKMALRHGAMALVYFPGGFGTMDELFEVLTLMQTRKMKRVPIVLVGEKSYWDKVLDFEEFARMGLISDNDLSLFRFADTADGAWKAIVGSPALTKR